MKWSNSIIEILYPSGSPVTRVFSKQYAAYRILTGSPLWRT